MWLNYFNCSNPLNILTTSKLNRQTMRRTLLAAVLLIAACAYGKNEISIETSHIQLVLQVKDDGRLYQTYLGERIEGIDDLSVFNMPRLRRSHTLTRGFEAYPVVGTEDFFEQALEITHADGNPTSVLKYVSHEQKPGEGFTETIIQLRDDVYPLSVTLHYAAYANEDIIRQWSEIKHDEKGKVYLGRYYSSMLYLEERAYYLTEFASDWAREMQMSSQQLQYGKKIIDSRLGARATMFAQPFFEVGLDSPASEEEGRVLMGTLGWTGNFRFTFEVDNNGALRIVSGINPDASRYLLPRGQVFRTPDFYFTLSSQGVGEGSRRFQRWALRHQLHMGAEDRMTLLNNWENTYFDFNEEKLTNLFGEAKSLGVDLFLLDDGWFGNKYPRSNDKAGLGDWEATREKLPNGVPALVKAANERGVEFGIWIEPEMVNPKSELAEQHPDWIIRLPERDTYYQRNQLVLDLTNPKVQDYVFSIVDRLMQENPRLKFFKWDCNSPITNIYSAYEKEQQGNLYVDFVRGLYNVLQRIQAKYPQLYMMMCSGGGGRSDFEGLRYFSEFWLSDNTDPVERLFIQWGYSQFMPSKAMCAHVTNWNRQASVKFRLDVAFSCKLGFDISLKDMAASDLKYCQQAIAEYNRLKPLIFSPNLYRLYSPYEGPHCVMQRVSDDQAHALLMAYDIHPRYGERVVPVRLRGLNAQMRYRVREICLMEGQKSRLACNDKVYSGDYLMKAGLAILSASDMTSHIIELTRE